MVDSRKHSKISDEWVYSNIGHPVSIVSSDIEDVLSTSIIDFYQYLLAYDLCDYFRADGYDGVYLEDLAKGASNTVIRRVRRELREVVLNAYKEMLSLYRDHQGVPELRLRAIDEVSGKR